MRTATYGSPRTRLDSTNYDSISSIGNNPITRLRRLSGPDARSAGPTSVDSAIVIVATSAGELVARLVEFVGTAYQTVTIAAASDHLFDPDHRLSNLLKAGQLREVLEEISRLFALSQRDLAATLQISRQTLSTWLSGELTTAQLRSGNVNRLRDIISVATLWENLCGRSLRPLYRLSLGGRTLRDLLTAAVIDRQQIRNHLDALVKIVERGDRSRVRGQRRQRAGFVVSDASDF